MDSKTIANACHLTAQAAKDALGWVADARNAQKVSQERSAMEQKLRRIGSEARRLGRSVERPTCVGVFGPSQQGKSYLVSILARNEGRPLIATFAGERREIDFIAEINPQGGQESTGIVTRFTIHRQEASPEFPVCLRLLSEVDILKIIVNSYFQDGDQEFEVAPDAAAVERHVVAAEAAANGSPLGFTEADVWDLQEYVHRNSGGAALAAVVEPFWPRIAAAAPRLAVAQRAELMSILWCRHATFTAIYTRLAEALALLSFSADVFCKISALIPSRNSIINVEALQGFHNDQAPRLDVMTKDGRVTSLPRPLLTALIAELRIVCRDRPMPFFDHTDLLDFPGYLPRQKYNLKTYFRDAADSASEELIRRGKVDYLFQRYTSELELTTMILCIADGPMKVPILPKVVESWVAMTHGATPDKRLGKPNLLFFAMTMFDRTLESKAGDVPDNLGEKFENRFNASFSPFAKIEPSWVKQWEPRQPFRNLFLIRNPNVHFTGVIEYEGDREVRFSSGEALRIANLREAFVAQPATARHLADPAGAWDAMMALNDGGAGRLAQALERVCAPELKLGQVSARLVEIQKDGVDLLGRHFISDDFEKRRIERLAMVHDTIFPDLNECAERGAFGSALRGMMVDASELHAALVESINRPSADREEEASEAPVRKAGPFGGVKRDVPPTAPRLDRWTRLANAALSCWAVFLRGRIEEPSFGNRIGISQASLNELVAELGAAARRLSLAERIAEELRHRAAAAEQNDAIARRAALVAERLINRFVSELDFDRMGPERQLEKFGSELTEPAFARRPVTYDIGGIASQQPDFATDFMAQWGRAFLVTVSQNAMSKTGSAEDAVQNARLGKILEAMVP